MVRGAAKNHAHVGVLTSPDDYGPVLEELRAAGSLSDETRRRLARAAFAHTAGYDAAIVEWFDEDELLPDTLHLTLERAEELHYGENPHQRGARYRLAGGTSWWDAAVLHGGRALSYLNLFDTDAGWRLVHELGAAGRPAVAIMKHANPSGAAVADDLATAYRLALASDELSAFGGVVAIGGSVDAELAEVVAAGPQADVIVAEGFDEAALERLRARRRLTRLLSAPAPEKAFRQFRTLGHGALVQDGDELRVTAGQWAVVSRVVPSADQLADLALAWTVCARTSSNAIVLVNGGATVGVGAGQQSRVVAADIAIVKAAERAKGAAAASDAFFPFPDGLEVLARAGVSAVVHPGGSIGDAAVIAAADEAGIALVTTGERHFRH
jgi:phosphoribosylaminoimidazolecarboxamide formyltransferase/IMP cyclohydrolase